METPLLFKIYTMQGEVYEQQITIPPEVPTQTAIDRMLSQYAQIGMLKKQETGFLLVPCHQIKKVEVDTPTLVIANTEDATQVTKASDTLKKIIL